MDFSTPNLFLRQSEAETQLQKARNRRLAVAAWHGTWVVSVQRWPTFAADNRGLEHYQEQLNRSVTMGHLLMGVSEFQLDSCWMHRQAALKTNLDLGMTVGKMGGICGIYLIST